MESLETNLLAKNRVHRSAEHVLSQIQAPFEFGRVLARSDKILTVLTIPTQGLNEFALVGESYYLPGGEYDDAFVEATKDAVRPQGQDTSLSGVIIDFRTRERTVFLNESADTTWVATGRTFEEAIVNGFAAMTANKEGNL